MLVCLQRGIEVTKGERADEKMSFFRGTLTGPLLELVEEVRVVGLAKDDHSLCRRRSFVELVHPGERKRVSSSAAR